MIALRGAREDDLASIRALVEAAYAPWIALIGRRPGPMDDDYAARIAAGEAQVAEADGTILGLLVTERHDGFLLIDNVAVAPGQQGRGIGRALLAAAEGEARRAGVPRLRLYTHARMATNIALYARAGFSEIARVSEKGFDRVYMEKPLAAEGGPR
ncbi:GNAT family N-acetyltransferase [Elioraea rosea]|uniref:GNAT family N-acetyltransferase n=1 Tax=Elioraea rosea TaxID=2492390 RepID=UPI0011846F41|nr:GNAT family N-acetyltransferase [Elioraea rosea]